MQKNHDSHAKESDSEQTILQGHVEMDSTEDSNMCTRHNCSTQPDGERGGNFASSIDDEINHTSESPPLFILSSNMEPLLIIML